MFWGLKDAPKQREHVQGLVVALTLELALALKISSNGLEDFKDNLEDSSYDLEDSSNDLEDSSEDSSNALEDIK